MFADTILKIIYNHRNLLIAIKWIWRKIQYWGTS